jgi:predicted ArsR family transcriptional regulator
MTKYEKTLNRLSRLLRRKPMTAREIADALRCCVPVVYRRLQALEERGERLYCRQTKSSAPGVKAKAYGLL